ncbi:MAG: hypothetical protein JWM07_637 [Candidatus Saccharibacteria bacterium]|jgi:hypothetical protein|nr:hypothetical protein [Candidatus Saccharibacteria bacterium]
MLRDTLNKTISIPDLPRNPHVWGTPDANTIYNDHLVDPFTETVREEWLTDETNSNPLVSAEIDTKESRYESELGSLAVHTKNHEPSLMDEDEDPEQDEPDDDEANVDGYYAS